MNYSRKFSFLLRAAYVLLVLAVALFVARGGRGFAGSKTSDTSGDVSHRRFYVVHMLSNEVAKLQKGKVYFLRQRLGDEECSLGAHRFVYAKDEYAYFDKPARRLVSKLELYSSLYDLKVHTRAVSGGEDVRAPLQLCSEWVRANRGAAT